MSPLKLFEYMSAGKPILTSNLPVIKEILTHNETAFLCDPSVIDDWGDSIEWIKQNPKDSAKISLKAFEKFSSLQSRNNILAQRPIGVFVGDHQHRQKAQNEE